MIVTGFLEFGAYLIIWGFIIRLIQVKFSDTSIAKALATVY